ncbi:type IV secretory system conjugative DNA transfer family protein [Parasphingorhabdus sp.]|uniref:type IV secretory system conjugative DNA transfer family protein n=1 Tax=Parasphingorhabdus sp. TaxID=2709688 RepID=UPI003A8F4DF3
MRQQWQQVEGLFDSVGAGNIETRDRFIANVAADACAILGIFAPNDQAQKILGLTASLFDYEQILVLPDLDWSKQRTIAELWDIREELTRQRGFAEDIDQLGSVLRDAVAEIFRPIFVACPALLDTAGDKADGISVKTDLLRSIANLGDVTDHILQIAHADELADLGLFTYMRDRLGRNMVAASGGNPADPQNFNRALKMPAQYDAKTPEQLVTTYLAGTPLLELFDQELNFTIPTLSRFEHHHIIAGSGHGKTQTLQYLIAQDLAKMEHASRSIIVLDSQGDLIRNIAQMAIFAPDGPLHDKIVIIDPSDVEWPVSLNLFDVGMDRLAGYEPLERERLTNSILELYDFVLGTLLDAQMTQKQNVIFRYVTRLMLHIPDATIHTLRELMEPGGEKKFASSIAKLTGTAKHFFETEFTSREFEQTKKQVLRRLWGILENQTFERMFSHPRSKLDLFKEMNAGKIILINTAKDLLKEQGTEIFGRFFIAMIAQAAQERASLPASKRIPTFVYIDEAQDYFDRNIGLILAQARKYNVGMVLAHQYLGQLEPKLQEAFGANTSIKFAGGVSAKDARVLAPMLYCQPEFIESQPKGSFASHFRGVTKGAVPLAFPFGVVEGLPQMSKDQRKQLQIKMRANYAVHHSVLGQTQESDEAEDLDEQITNDTKPEKSQPDKRPPGQVEIEPGDNW